MLQKRLFWNIIGKTCIYLTKKDVACLQEMGMLFACMKDNEFVEKYCHKEIQQFQNCFKYYMDRKFKAKKTVNQGFVQPGNNLNYKQLNKYMRRFPNPVRIQS
uniref:CHCH domain-containing protein n=1 Tax=Drosophila pseudoobscura pseudoobscura TaxID=46245 RepID=A0A0R3P2P9_DROPS